jgi:ribosomal protein S18 acetylase RimI-like enzyme
VFTLYTVTVPDDPNALELLREYLGWATTLEADSHKAPTFQGIGAEMNSLPDGYGPPDGRIIVAMVDGTPAGCIALTPHGKDSAEIKRLYVRERFREHGLGARLVAGAIDAGREKGYRRIVLESHNSMRAAHRLYEEAGFTRHELPTDYPADLRDVVIYMEMPL